MQQTQVSTTSSLDPEAVNLAKAIRQTESGGNFQAKGKSGEYGAYQFTEPTWNIYAKKHGVNVRLFDATPEQQNEVAYKQIKEWKDSGYNVGQIASMWNAGEKKPDAYRENYSGVNRYGVSYDVPKYAESVAKAYQALKAGQQVGVDPNNPSSIASTQNIDVAPAKRSSGEAPEEGYSISGFGKNILKSGAGVVGGLIDTIAHPIDTIKGLGKAVLGTAELLIPGEQGDEETARNIGRFFKERYGGVENIKNSLYNDPIGVLLDASTVLGIGGGLLKSGASISEASKASTLAKAGFSPEIAKIATSGNSSLRPIANTLTRASEVIDPLRQVTKGVKGLVGLGGKSVAGGLGVTTGKGGEAIKSIYESGKEGGEILKQTTDALRGKTPPEGVLNTIKGALTDLKNQRRANYLEKFENYVKANKSVLPFEEIKSMLKKQLDNFGIKSTEKGLDFSGSSLGDRAAQNTVREIYEDVSKWNDFTPQGLDTLKRRLSSYYSPSNDARAIAASTENAVDSVLKNNIPEYETMTKGYREASEALKEVESAVGGSRSTQESALRKVRSIFRDSQKERLSTVGKLEQKTGRNIKGQVAGMIMNPVIPEGLQKFATEGAALGFAGGVLPAAGIPGLVATSPRIVAESARLLGITARQMENLLSFIEKQSGLNRNEILQLLVQQNRVNSTESLK